MSVFSQEFAYNTELWFCLISLFAPNLFMLSFCFPNKWPSRVRGDVSFYADSCIKPPCSLSPALLAFPHNSDVSNPVIWHFSWPACPVFKMRWCNSSYLKVEVGSLPDSLKKLQFGFVCELQKKVWASSTCWLTLKPLDLGAREGWWLYFQTKPWTGVYLKVIKM